jgi:hypothetical protein
MNESQRNIRIALGMIVRIWRAGQLGDPIPQFDALMALETADGYERNDYEKFQALWPEAEMLAYPEVR